MNNENPIIKASEMPAPRLELRWFAEEGMSWRHRRCEYRLVLPLGEHDIRRENEECEKVRSESSHLLGTTRVTGGNDREPIWRETLPHPTIDTPFRDGAHAKWDSKVLGNLPVYAVVGDEAQLQESQP